MSRTARHLVLGLAALLVAAPAFAAATITIVNVDGPGEGFNDPTPAAPVGGNPGTTVGQQRLLAFQFAADLWGAVLDSDVEIRIQASFDPLACTATSGTLGAAGSLTISANFPGAEVANTWYHAALANKLSGADQSASNDLVAFFNSNLGQPTCLPSRFWYYGFDTGHGTGINLVTVLLHEFGHGLGFANFVTEQTGASPLGLPDIYGTYSLDLSTGKHWNEMTVPELVASAVNSRRVVWDGINVTNAVPTTLNAGTPALKVTSPAILAGNFPVGAAAFGPALTAAGVAGTLELANDGVGAVNDGCEAIVNNVVGKVAVIDRGTCGFTVKVKNAQNAGAIAVVIADNAAGSPPAGMAGTDATIVIPSVRVTLPDGNAIKAQLGGGVTASLLLDTAQLAGADLGGRMLLNAPNPVAPGSSISHWDPIASPNLLMEPAINSDLPIDLDLTYEQMVDIGWFSDADGVPDGLDECIGSDTAGTVIFGSCDSGVEDEVFANGCRLSDLIDRQCGSVPLNRFQNCVNQYAKTLRDAGILTQQERNELQHCANRYAQDARH
ncbi:MAG: PA domain-containing protein [Thermoanaerobaculia bacterium]|nr:PA domain-containing protein [Thermoanaerobaculia bacterium]